MDPITFLLLIAILLLLVIIILLIIYLVQIYMNNSNDDVCIKPLSMKQSDFELMNKEQESNSGITLIEPIKGVSINPPTNFEREATIPMRPTTILARPDLNNLVITESPNTAAVLNNSSILNYDRSKLYDPLVEPTRRVDRYELPQYYFRNMIDFPTRGYPDNYNQLGILVNSINNNYYDSESTYDDDSTYDSINYRGKSKYRNTNKINIKERKSSRRSSKRKSKQDKYRKKYYRELLSNNKKTNENNILRLFGRQQYPGSNTWEYYVTVYSGLDAIKIPLYPNKKELYTDDYVFVPQLKSSYVVQLYDYDAPRYYPDII